MTNCWLHFLGYAGVWRGWLPLNIVSLGGTVWIFSLLTWPITLLLVLSAWHRLEPSQLESDVAVSGWWLIRGLLLPLARTALAQAAVLTFVLALNNFAVPAILQVKVFPAEMWVRFNTTFDTAGALLLSWPWLWVRCFCCSGFRAVNFLAPTGSPRLGKALPPATRPKVVLALWRLHRPAHPARCWSAPPPAPFGANGLDRVARSPGRRPKRRLELLLLRRRRCHRRHRAWPLGGTFRGADHVFA